MSDLYRIRYPDEFGFQTKYIHCTFSCACTIASILNGIVIDIDDKQHLPFDHPDILENQLGMAIASEMLLNRAIEKQRKRK